MKSGELQSDPIGPVSYPSSARKYDARTHGERLLSTSSVEKLENLL